MKKRYFLLPLLFLISIPLSAQLNKPANESNQRIGIFYGMGLHSKTNFATNIPKWDEADITPYIRKIEPTKVIQFGMTYDYISEIGLGLRTGFLSSLHFDFKEGYSVIGNYLPQYTLEIIDPTWEYDISRITIPLHIAYSFNVNAKYLDRIQLYIGPNATIYLPIWDFDIYNSTYTSGQYLPAPVPLFSMSTTYKDTPSKYFSTSSIKWEGTIGFQLEKSFRFGDIALGFEYLLGTKELEETKYTVMPGHPTFETEHTFQFNRSYYAFNLIYFLRR